MNTTNTISWAVLPQQLCSRDHTPPVILVVLTILLCIVNSDAHKGGEDFLIQNYSETNLKCLRVFLIIWNCTFCLALHRYTVVQVFSTYYAALNAAQERVRCTWLCLHVCLCTWKSEAKFCSVPHMHIKTATHTSSSSCPTYSCPKYSCPIHYSGKQGKRFSSPNRNSFPVPTHTNSCLPLPHPLSHQPQW